MTITTAVMFYWFHREWPLPAFMFHILVIICCEVWWAKFDFFFVYRTFLRHVNLSVTPMNLTQVLKGCLIAALKGKSIQKKPWVCEVKKTEVMFAFKIAFTVILKWNFFLWEVRVALNCWGLGWLVRDDGRGAHSNLVLTALVLSLFPCCWPLSVSLSLSRSPSLSPPHLSFSLLLSPSHRSTSLTLMMRITSLVRASCSTRQGRYGTSVPVLQIKPCWRPATTKVRLPTALPLHLSFFLLLSLSVCLSHSLSLIFFSLFPVFMLLVSLSQLGASVFPGQVVCSGKSHDPIRYTAFCLEIKGCYLYVTI